MQLEQLKARAAARVDERASLLDDLALRIHARPELAFEEVFACSVLCDALAAEGVSVERGLPGLETAFRADAGADTGTGSGATVAILAEYDALPGVGHACGHNLIGAGALGAFLAVRDVMPTARLRGSVRILGCPAEELGNGKVALIRAGAFRDVDAALMYHPGDRDEIDPLMLAMVNLDVSFAGKAAHAAAEPQAGINALDGLVLGWNAIAALRQVVRSDSRLHGIITDGGSAANIIPERAAARLMVRSPDNAYLRELQARVLACFEGSAKATGCSLQYRWSETCELVNSSRPLAESFRANAAALGRELRPRGPGQTHGSTDMGNVTTLVPGIHPFIRITDRTVPGHSHEFAQAARTEFALESMHLAAKALAMTALDVLCQPALRRGVKEAFDARK
ncbi:MAG: M20 family metallopeptidase [Chloroflexota bacterium]|nr:M20 family metallopeptidase [Chloroflexota bacterium]